MGKRKVGKPVEYTDEIISEINEKLNYYIDNTEIPIVSEFAYENKIRRATLYEIPVLSYTIKRLIEKKKANLERLGLTGEINVTMAIFSLKQLGWKDRHEFSGDKDNPLQHNVNLNNLSVKELEKLDELTAKINTEE